MSRPGESSNVERTGKRDAPLLNEFLSRLRDGVSHTGVMYQFCPDCRNVELIIGTPNKTMDNFDPALFPAQTVRVVDNDQNSLTVIAERDEVTMSRKQFVETLSYIHNKHIDDTNCSARRSEGVWADKWNRVHDDKDMILSQTIRAVPNVRHLDTDALLYDGVTNEPLLIIEESTDPTKAISMTLQLAQFLQCPAAKIITETSQDNADVTVYRPDGSIERRNASYGDLLAII